LHINGAADFFDVGLDDVHADAAAGDVGDFFGSREAGEEDEVDAFAFAHTRGLFRRDQAFFDGLAADLIGVEPAAIVGDLDDDLTAFVIRAQEQAPFSGFADSDAPFGLLDAVIDRVANDVRQRILDRLDDRLVKFGLFAFHFDAHLLATHGGDVAHGARKFAPDIADGLHARLHHAFLELGGDEVESLTGSEETGVFGGVRKLEDLVAREDEFADEIHELVEQRDIDADGAFARGGARLRLGGGFGAGRSRSVIGGVLDMLGPGFDFGRCFGDGRRRDREFDGARSWGSVRRRNDWLNWRHRNGCGGRRCRRGRCFGF
jgi:hypothetical protein